MKRVLAIFAGSALIAVSAPAQEGEGREAAMQAMQAQSVVRLADADKNGEVSGAEWELFLAAVKTDTEGTSDVAKIKGIWVMATFDKDGDKALKTDDLTKIFAGFDKDGDKALSKAELAPQQGGRGAAGGQGGGFNREEMMKKYDVDGDGTLSEDERAKMREEIGGGAGGQGGEGRRGQAANANPSARLEGALLGKADADADGAVTADEFAAFIKALGPDDKSMLAPAKLFDAVFAPRKDAPEADAPGAGRARFGGMGGGNITQVVDADGDGKVPTAELNKMFTTIDKNGDKSIQKDELQPNRGGGAGGDGRRPRRIDD